MNSPKKHPIAPPVYRAQPIPKVLQTKTAAARQPLSTQSPRKPAAPPVYRPEHKQIVQPKINSRPHNPSSPPAQQPASPRRPSAAIQCVRNITPGTHVQVNGAGGTWHGEVFRVRDDDSYEICVGGTDTTNVVGEASVTLHPTRAQMGIGKRRVYLRQHGTIYPQPSPHATDSWFNCIAAVAHHEESGYAAFTHYNTTSAFRMEQDDDDSENYRLLIDIPG